MSGPFTGKIVLEKKTTVTVWMFNTYQVRNHFIPNPTNPKLKRLKKHKMRKSLLFCQNNSTKYYFFNSWLAEMLQSGLSSQYCTINIFLFVQAFSTFYWSRKLFFQISFDIINFEFVGFGTKWILTW